MHYENLVFGATLDSLFFAMKNGYPLIYSTPKKPFELDESLQHWKHAYFFLSLSGLIPFADKAKRLKVIGNNKIEVLTDKKRHEISYNTLFVFDDISLKGLPDPIGTTSDEVLIYDKMEFVNFVIEKDIIIDSEVGLLTCNPPSSLTCKSLLNLSNYTDEQNSELYYRFRTEDVVSEHFSRSIELKSINRTVTPLGKNIYNPIDGIIFVDNPEEINYSSSNDYLTKLLGYLRG